MTRGTSYCVTWVASRTGPPSTSVKPRSRQAKGITPSAHGGTIRLTNWDLRCRPGLPTEHPRTSVDPRGNPVRATIERGAASAPPHRQRMLWGQGHPSSNAHPAELLRQRQGHSGQRKRISGRPRDKGNCPSRTDTAATPKATNALRDEATAPCTNAEQATPGKGLGGGHCENTPLGPVPESTNGPAQAGRGNRHPIRRNGTVKDRGQHQHQGATTRAQRPSDKHAAAAASQSPEMGKAHHAPRQPLPPSPPSDTATWHPPSDTEKPGPPSGVLRTSAEDHAETLESPPTSPTWGEAAHTSAPQQLTGSNVHANARREQTHRQPLPSEAPDSDAATRAA
ncbi:hypothetical protein WOLCODRAFT_152655 [Wolfiporia cocos MD-104 SS10]|uniref:Uncharacterized protein n=1 Tax=Wolfiporia cocos (strain MD-104) TaxID=742152 RepID=A0A2H3JKA4_WOLCO|nr:hypothetical protein WOLCODRAFT_152655 [Wolfiporia cocos MD-104 SS10]